MKKVTKMMEYEPGTSSPSTASDIIGDDKNMLVQSLDAVNPRSRVARRAAKNPHLVPRSLPSNNVGDESTISLNRQEKRALRLERVKNTSTRQRVRTLERKNKLELAAGGGGGPGSSSADERSCRPGYTPVDQDLSDSMTEHEKKAARESAEIAMKLKAEADAVEAVKAMEAKKIKATKLVEAAQLRKTRAEALAADWTAHETQRDITETTDDEDDDDDGKTPLDHLSSDEDESSDDDNRGPTPLSQFKSKPAEEKREVKSSSSLEEVVMPSRLQKLIENYCNDGEKKSEEKVTWVAAFGEGCRRALNNPKPWQATGSQTSTFKPNPEPDTIEGRGLTHLYNEIVETNFIGEKFVRLHHLVLAHCKRDLTKDQLMDFRGQRHGSLGSPLPTKTSSALLP